MSSLLEENQEEYKIIEDEETQPKKIYRRNCSTLFPLWYVDITYSINTRYNTVLSPKYRSSSGRVYVEPRYTAQHEESLHRSIELTRLGGSLCLPLPASACPRQLQTVSHLQPLQEVFPGDFLPTLSEGDQHGLSEIQLLFNTGHFRVTCWSEELRKEM